MNSFKAVCIGGGTGQPNLLRVMRTLDCESLHAIVAMADDGGSTGILRERAHIIPPGDIRKCLSALAKDQDSAFARAFAHRFPYVEDHALGNLILTALTEETDSFVEAVRICEDLLECVGSVNPSTLDNVELEGCGFDGSVIRGQAALCHGSCALDKVWLNPQGAQAYQPAVDCIMQADIIVLGPGSLFTSIIPNILVDGIRDAIIASPGKVVFVCPKADRQGETWGMDAEEYLAALERHGLEGAIDVMLVHRSRNNEHGVATRSFDAHTHDIANVSKSKCPVSSYSFEYRDVKVDDDILARIRERVEYVFVRDFNSQDSPVVHDPNLLRDVFAEVIPCLLPQK